MSVGQCLRRARLNSGLTLDGVSHTTKIPLWILHSIELDDFSRVPGGVFVRGYLGAFARAVGLDANEILTSHFGPPREAVTAPPEVRRPGYTGTPLWQLAALVVLVVATAVVWRDAWKRADDAQANAPSPVELAPQVPPTPRVALTSTALPSNAHDQSAPVVTAAVTTVVSETPTNGDDVVASQEPATTSATDPSDSTALGEPDSSTQIDP